LHHNNTCKKAVVVDQNMGGANCIIMLEIQKKRKIPFEHPGFLSLSLGTRKSDVLASGTLEMKVENML